MGSRQLDGGTIERYLMDTQGLSRETIQTFMAEEGGGFGAGPDVVSAYCIYAFDVDRSIDKPSLSFPGGNDGIARHMVKRLIPDAIPGPNSLEAVCRNSIDFQALDRPGQPTRIRLASTAIGVQHEGNPATSNFVSIAYSRGGKLYRIKARSVVMAGGSWTTKRVVRDLPATHLQAYDQFYRSPCMMVNVALRNWRFLYKMGLNGFRWLEGIGNYTEVRKTALVGADSPTLGPDSPIVLNLKVLFSYPGMAGADQGHRGRG